jgi:arabinogalactan oligomer/maltooligosaccharide transport system permease protein
MRRKKNKIITNTKLLILNTITYFFLTIFTLATLYPVIQVLSISLRPGDRLFSTSLAIIPQGFTLESYKVLIFDKPFFLWLRNSALISFLTTILGVVLASTAGYAFSRFHFHGRNIGMISLLVSQMFPATMLMLPLFIMLAKFHLINSFAGLFIIYSATALPFCIWQMKGYYDTLPQGLEEAATIDGATKFQAFYKIILPLASPALVITALFSFMSSWSEYVVAAQVLQDPALYTLPLGLKQFTANMQSEWGLYAAAALVVSIPVIVLFLILNRWLVSGLSLGSVKG